MNDIKDILNQSRRFLTEKQYQKSLDRLIQKVKEDMTSSSNAPECSARKDASTACQPAQSPLDESISKSTSSDHNGPWHHITRSIHPGHCMLVASLPFCIGAYRLSRRPLSTLVEQVARIRSHGQLKNMSELTEAEENVRRAVGVAVASRALALATLGSFGAFGLICSGKFGFIL